MRVVGYDSLAEELVVAPGPERVPLEGELELLPGERRCPGALRDGEWVGCGELVGSGAFCPEHSDWSPCAACRGECLKEEKDCFEAHVLYLALFAPDVVKVGVTKRDRFERRMREQGADAGRVLAVFPDGESARRAEAAAPHRDAVPTAEKMRSLHREPDPELLRDGFEEFRYFARPPVRPVRLGPGDPVVGGVVGVKGRVLVVENKDVFYGVDLRDLVGFSLDGSGSPVQSAFSAFTPSD